jgi:hypothetical protein
MNEPKLDNIKIAMDEREDEVNISRGISALLNQVHRESKPEKILQQLRKSDSNLILGFLPIFKRP